MWCIESTKFDCLPFAVLLIRFFSICDFNLVSATGNHSVVFPLAFIYSHGFMPFEKCDVRMTLVWIWPLSNEKNQNNWSPKWYFHCNIRRLTFARNDKVSLSFMCYIWRTFVTTRLHSPTTFCCENTQLTLIKFTNRKLGAHCIQ